MDSTKRATHFVSRHQEIRKLLKAIRTMMHEIVVNAPRDDKNGWKLQKFHDMLHTVRT